jgi:hypothetical protein
MRYLNFTAHLNLRAEVKERVELHPCCPCMSSWRRPGQFYFSTLRNVNVVRYGICDPPHPILPSLCLVFTLPVFSCIFFFISVCLPLCLSYFFPAEMGQMTVPTPTVLFLVHHRLLIEERLQKVTWLLELCLSKTRDLFGWLTFSASSQ